MGVVLVVKGGDDFTELCQNIVVARHVCSQDASDNTLTYLSGYGNKVEEKWQIAWLLKWVSLGFSTT